MSRYLVNRVLLMLPTLLGAAVLTFAVLRVVPGDIALARYGGEGAQVPDEVLRAERARFGLDRPIALQFVDWLGGMLHGDFGVSMWTGRPVGQEISIRLELSLEVAIVAMLVSLAIAVPLGILSAVRQDTLLDYAVRIFSVGGQSLPAFWLGVLIVLFLLVSFRWSPPVTFTSIRQDPLANLSQVVWPALAVGYRGAAVMARMMRSSLLEVLREDYVRTARAKGLHERGVVLRHAVRNALLPVVTLAGLEFAGLLGGLVVTEQVFNLNWVGKLVVEAISRRDYTLTQALVMLSATAFVAINFVVDLAYAAIDPRLRFR